MKARAVRSENPVPYRTGLSIPMSQRCERCGGAPMSEEQIVARALEILAARHAPGKELGSPRDTMAYLQLTLGEREREFFAVLFLDNRHRVIALEEIFSGTIDGCSVHVREIARRALQLNSAAVILAHNHPSGLPEPSMSDQHITTRLQDALALVDVRTLDHIVVGTQGAVSFAERGLI